MGLAKRTALVLGASGGIGKAIATRLSEEGCGVAIVSRSESETKMLAEQLSETGSPARAYVGDVANVEDMRRIAGEVKMQFGTLDIMVNSAGTSHIGPMVINSSEAWREVIETNLMGAVASSHAVLRHMIPAKWGRIIYIGSISAEVGAAYNAVYAASKAGVAGLVRSLALEVARAGITVNAVAPGYVRTEFFGITQGARAKLKGISLEEHIAELVAEVPANRLVRPDEVAATVAFLCTEESGAITGQSINVDGGRTAT